VKLAGGSFGFNFDAPMSWSYTDQAMQGRLELHFFDFVRHIRGAEVIDDLALTPAQCAAKKADVFFVGRRVVCEVKVLASDTSHKIAPILESYEKTGRLAHLLR
jgi:hypothetical protein